MFKTMIGNELIEFIQGSSGQLELAVARQTEKAAPWGVICHPHPLFGGTMDNKIVTTLTRVFQHFKLNTIRFNFRGVGKSEGAFDKGRGELDDLMAVIAWLRTQAPVAPLWLGGFSFGAYVSAKAAMTLQPEVLVSVAPPVVNFLMSDVEPVLKKWVLVQGMQDDVVSPEAVIEWAKERTSPPEILTFPNAGHFFHGELGTLRSRLEEVLG